MGVESGAESRGFEKPFNPEQSQRTKEGNVNTGLKHSKMYYTRTYAVQGTPEPKNSKQARTDTGGLTELK